MIPWGLLLYCQLFPSTTSCLAVLHSSVTTSKQPVSDVPDKGLAPLQAAGQTSLNHSRGWNQNQNPLMIPQGNWVCYSCSSHNQKYKISVCKELQFCGTMTGLKYEYGLNSTATKTIVHPVQKL